MRCVCFLRYSLWISGALALAAVLGLGRVHAAEFLPWNDHAKPFDFLFNGGADIDMHQQTLLNRSTKQLFGFLYIQFTGAVSRDGYRVAIHGDCNAPDDNCKVGWLLQGQPANARLVYQAEPDHPTWLVDRADIPQPGAFSHFHWSDTTHAPLVGTVHSGFLLRLESVDTFCFVHHDGVGFDEKRSCEDDVNNGVIVRPGIDIATHVNIVGSYPGYVVP
jgi:hypothetical protein